jgi:melibiase-like protein
LKETSVHNPFTPVASVPVDPRKARVHEEGWQSWSPSGAYALGDSPYRPANDNWATVCYRPGVTVPGGVFQGEGLLALDPGDGSPVRLWAATDPLGGVPSVRLAMTDDAVAEVTADGPVKEWTGPGIQSVLGTWADSLRIPTPRPAPTVWCSWYEYFTAVTEDDIHENLRAMDTLDLPVDVVQIDDGYQKALGDWLTLSGRFRSRAGIADAIRARGRRAGIWTAPFLVDPASDLAAEHPEWLVRTADGDFTHAGRNWGHDLRVLDTTHPGAAAYLTEVFRTLRAEGYDYFKVDFLYAGALEGVRHEPVDPRGDRRGRLPAGLRSAPPRVGRSVRRDAGQSGHGPAPPPRGRRLQPARPGPGRVHRRRPPVAARPPLDQRPRLPDGPPGRRDPGAVGRARRGDRRPHGLQRPSAVPGRVGRGDNPPPARWSRLMLKTDGIAYFH